MTPPAISNVKTIAFVLVTVLVCCAMAGEVAFQSFAPADGRSFEFIGMSHDGTWIVGEVRPGNGSFSQSAVWSATHGLEILESGLTAWDASNSGQIVVNNFGDALPAVALWQQNGPGELFGISIPLDGHVAAAGWISGDGTSVLGVTRWREVGVARPAVWNAPDFVVHELPQLPDFEYGFPSGVSTDGQVAIGTVLDNSHEQIRAVEWEIPAQTVDFITDADGNVFDAAVAISPDSTAVIVRDFGESHSFLLIDGEKHLLPPGALAVSNLGQRVVGASRDGFFVWDIQDGIQFIEAILNQAGIPTDNWTFETTFRPEQFGADSLDISADGETISGLGWRDGQGSGWVLHLPLSRPAIPESSTVALIMTLTILLVRTRLNRRSVACAAL